MRLGSWKHGFSLLAALAVIATPGFAQTDLKGDPSGDGNIGELNDAFIARQIAIGRRAYDARADVFPFNDDCTLGDGEVTVADVLVFLQGLVGLMGPDVPTSKLRVGRPIAIRIARSPESGPLLPGETITLTGTRENASETEVTGVTYAVSGDAAQFFTITPTTGLGATIQIAAGATIPSTLTSITVTATPTGPATEGRTRVGICAISIPLAGHDQGGGG